MKYFEKRYKNRIAYGKCAPGDGINYNNPTDGKYDVKFITEQQYLDGIKNMLPIPWDKEQYIENKKNEIAIEALKNDGVLDSEGNLI